PLAAALLGAAISTIVLQRSQAATGPIGVAVMALFGLLVIGRFFGELTSLHAILLFGAPLLGWLPEFPLVRSLPPLARGLLRVILVAVITAAVVVDAQRKFVANSQAPSSSEPGEATVQDYMNFGR